MKRKKDTITTIIDVPAIQKEVDSVMELIKKLQGVNITISISVNIPTKK